MSGILSKRQQARNEKALQDLVHNVPGNNLCADCHARNPGWASWSLGVFLCMRCAAIHRKLGTHISKVKSLSMDSWTNEQVDNMRKVGNTVSNQIYNPEGRKASMPVDVDEADSAMERFIRQKYIHNATTDASRVRSRGSDEGTPPPLPPKNSTKFGLRSASSIFPLSSRAKKEHRAASGSSASSLPSSRKPNKPSEVLGSNVSHDGPEDTEKLSRLREMGFHDTQRNVIVLKGVNGNLDRAVEALVRLGEGRSRSPAPAPPPREPALRTTRSLTPLKSSSSPGLGSGLSVPQKATSDRPTTASTTSTNPFDMLPTAQPQTAQSTGTLQNKNPYNGTNPFGAPSQQQHVDFVSQAFQGLNVSTSQPGLYSPTNGGNPMQSHQQPLHQQYMSPSAPTSPQNYQPINFQSSMSYPQPTLQPQMPMQTGYNPFFSQPSSPTPPQQNLFVNTTQTGYANNPFMRSPTSIISPSLGQIPEQAQSNFTQVPLTSSPQPLATSANPFFSNMQPQPGQQQVMTHQSFYQQPRQDTASILALYNQPNPNLVKTVAAGPNLGTNASSIPENLAVHTQYSQQLPPVNQQPRSPTQAPPGQGTNPYMSQTKAQADPFAQNRVISRDSMNLGMDMAWTNGRHSPDAFASLSARQ